MPPTYDTSTRSLPLWVAFRHTVLPQGPSVTLVGGSTTFVLPQGRSLQVALTAILPQGPLVTLVGGFHSLPYFHKFVTLVGFQFRDLCDFGLRPSMTSPAGGKSSKIRALHRICPKLFVSAFSWLIRCHAHSQYPHIIHKIHKIHSDHSRISGHHDTNYFTDPLDFTRSAPEFSSLLLGYYCTV